MQTRHFICDCGAQPGEHDIVFECLNFVVEFLYLRAIHGTQHGPGMSEVTEYLIWVVF